MKRGLLSALVPLIGLAIAFYLINSLRSSIRNLETLEVAHHSIGTPPGAVLLTYSGSYKINRALVTSTYVTDLPISAVRAFYGKALSTAGWNEHSAGPLLEWGMDKGRTRITYCNGEYEAYLEFTGQDLKALGYSFMLAWGYSGCD